MKEVEVKSKSLKSKCKSKVLDRVLKMMFKNSVYKNIEIFNQEMEKRQNESLNTSVVDKYKFKLEMEKKFINDMPIYELTPKTLKNTKVIVYFHGGAYVEEISKQHIRFLESLAEKVGSKIIVPIYKLAPRHVYKDAYKDLIDFYNTELKCVNEDNLVFMGDSAGGGLALAFAQYLKNLGKAFPKDLYLISPWLDVSMSKGSEMKDIESKDLILGIDTLAEAGKLWAEGEDNIDNYLVSPINGNLEDFNKISIFTGTFDILNLDSKRLRDKLSNMNVILNYHEEEGLPHVYPILPLDESKEFLEIISNELNSIEN
ncbi:MAG: alpha/beta hydrolase fold domain-containing protein [Sarcina sp.]